MISILTLGRCRYELFIDDLPVWGFVGPPPEEIKDEEHIYIYTHKSFDINYNDNRVRSPLHMHLSSSQYFLPSRAQHLCIKGGVPWYVPSDFL